MTDLLYHWPKVARFGRSVPKTKFYERGALTTPVREKFVDQIRRITWAFKLAESTINLPGSTAVPEIQIFQIDAKGDDVAEAVLAAIDKTVRTPIIFEVTHGDQADRQVRMTATYKRVGMGTPKLSAYYTTEWQPEDAERRPLPTAITLPVLYVALLEPLIPVSPRPGEEVSDVAARLNAVGRLERDVASLERKLRTEPQFNRRVELRRSLRTKQAELEQQR